MAGGGGAWKVAYADFVTAMMAFFMVMWLIGLKPEIAPAIQKAFNDPWSRYKINANRVRNPTMEEPKPGETKTKKKFAGSNPKIEPHDDPESPVAKKPRVVTVREAIRSTVGTVVYFQVGSSELTAESKQGLELLAPKLKGLPQKIQILAHNSMEAASTSPQDSELALDLCYQRSKVVRNFLRDAGIPDDRMRLAQAGPHESLKVDPNIEGDDKNARVEVFLLAETTESTKATSSKDRPKMDLMDEKKAAAWLEENGGAPKEKPKSGH